MGYFEGEFYEKFKRLAIDNDNLLSNSDIIEYYFDQGALFKTSDLNGVTIAAGDKQFFEITNGVNTIRIYNKFITTLATKFQISVYEMPNRDLSAEADATELSILVPNRTNKKNFPIKIYEITQGSSLEYTMTELQNQGELIDDDRYELSANQGSVESSGALTSETDLQMDNENYNYVICIDNLDSQQEDFYLKLVCGVPEFLPNS